MPGAILANTITTSSASIRSLVRVLPSQALQLLSEVIGTQPPDKRGYVRAACRPANRLQLRVLGVDQPAKGHRSFQALKESMYSRLYHRKGQPSC